MLTIEDLHAKTGEVAILKGVDLVINEGEVVALMGPNGSGKSTLAAVLMGHPNYQVKSGSVRYYDQDLLHLSPQQRAAAGIFLSFQYPQEVAGVTVGNFLRLAYNATHTPTKSVSEFLTLLKNKLQLLNMPIDFINRAVNEGFSGGEKKRAEILQLAVLEPRLAILDETDSGLDIDSLALVAQALQTIRKGNPRLTLLIITHYQRILNHLPADRIAIMRQGRIIRQGDASLLRTIEQKGYHSL